MWTDENRSLYERKGVRYPSDLTDREWTLIEALIPPAKRGGRPRQVDVREVLMLWDWDGTLERIHHALYVLSRELEGREASPSAGVIDSQSTKGAEKGGRASTRRAMMRARRSRAGSAISSSIPSA